MCPGCDPRSHFTLLARALRAKLVLSIASVRPAQRRHRARPHPATVTRLTPSVRATPAVPPQLWPRSIAARIGRYSPDLGCGRSFALPWVGQAGGSERLRGLTDVSPGRRRPSRRPCGGGRAAVAGIRLRREPCGRDVGDDDGDDHERRQGDASACRRTATISTDVSGKPNMATVIAPMPMRNPSDHRQTGKVGKGDAAGRADEHAGEGRAASEGAERDAVGQALADDEQHERADRPSARLLDERPGSASCPEKRTCEALCRDLTEERSPGRRPPVRPPASATPSCARRQAGAAGPTVGCRFRGRRRRCRSRPPRGTRRRPAS